MRLLDHIRPERTGWLHTTRLTQDVMGDYLKYLNPTPYVYCMSTYIRPGIEPGLDAVAKMRQLLATVRAANPGCMIGTGTSCNVLDDPNDGVDGFCNQYPAARLPRHAFPSDSDIWHAATVHPWVVDISDDARQRQLVNEHVAAACGIKESLGLTGRWTDNWWAKGADDYPFSHEQMLGLSDELTLRLNSHGISHAANWSTSLPNASALGLARIGQADAVFAEHATPKWTTPAEVAAGLAMYRAIIAQGAVLVLIDGDGNDLSVWRKLAALAMLLGGTLVGWMFSQPRQDWFSWPQKYGAPLGDYQQHGMVVSRQFAKGKISVDFSSMAVAA